MVIAWPEHALERDNQGPSAAIRVASPRQRLYTDMIQPGQVAEGFQPAIRIAEEGGTRAPIQRRSVRFEIEQGSLEHGEHQPALCGQGPGEIESGRCSKGVDLLLSSQVVEAEQP